MSEASPDKKGLCSLAPLRVLPDTLAAQYGVDLMTSFFLFFFGPKARGVQLPNQRSNPHLCIEGLNPQPLHWKAKS